MRLGNNQETFREVRVFLADANHKPADPTLVTGSMTIAPKEGPAFRKDFQFMMPDPAQGMPAGEATALPDGHEIRVAVVDYTKPFQRTEPAGGTPSPYFKADIPASVAEKNPTVTVEFLLPGGNQQKMELKSPFGK